MKRILAIILTVLMLVSALPLTSLAATYEVSNVEYSIKDVKFSCTEQEFRQTILAEHSVCYSVANTYNWDEIDTKGYYYSCLSSDFEKQVYDACYNITPTSLSVTIDTDFMNGLVYNGEEYNKKLNDLKKLVIKGMMCYRFDNVENCVSYDNTVNASLTEVQCEDETEVIYNLKMTLYLKNHPSYNVSLISKRDERIKEIANIASKKPSAYAKLKTIYEEIIKTSKYDNRSEALSLSYSNTEIFYYAHNSLGVLLNGEGVCESYAKAVKLVCDYMDIAPCILLTSSSHMWNVVYLDGKWYALDATWDDPGDTNEVLYTYFLCGDPDVVDGSSTSHKPDGVYTLAPQYADAAYKPCVSGHTIVKTHAVPAACTATGLTAGEYCSKCGEVFVAATTVDKLPHTIQYVPARMASYRENGNLAHYKCTVCSNLFSDCDGLNQITTEEITIPKLTDGTGCEHVFEQTVPAVAASTTECGWTEGRKCIFCDIYDIPVCEIPRLDKIVLSGNEYIYTGKVIKPTVTVTDVIGRIIDPSNYTVTYPSGCKLPGTYTITIKFKGNYSGTRKVTYKIVIPAPSPKASSSTSSIKLSWGKVSGASGYIIYDGAKKKLKDNKTATSYTISKCKAGTSYSYYVRTYKKIGGKTYYSDYVKKTTTTLPANTSVSASSSTSAIKLTWKKVTGATGYMVYNSSKTLLKDCGSALTNTFTGLKAGTSYTYYVRAYRTVGGKRYYSGYTKVSMTTKPVVPTVKFTSTTTTAKLSWGKVTGASGYIVYNGAKKKLSDRKTSTSYSISKLKAGTSYTYYVRAYRKAVGKTLYSDYKKITITTLPATPSLKASSNTTTIKLTWGKVTGATGYEIYNSSKTLIKDSASASTLSYSVTGNKVGAQYTFYVRAYKTVSGKKYYSGYAKVTYATKPSFNASSVTVGVGKTYKLALNTSASKVTWSSSNKSIATVSSSGVVTGKKAGTVTITAVANGQKATIKVVVTKVSLKISEKEYTLSPYYAHRLTITTNVTNPKITWTSSNTDVATVEGGYVYALSEGQTVITVRLEYGGATIKETCVVTVKIPTYSKYGFDNVPDFAAAVGNGISPKNATYTYGDEAYLKYRNYDIDWDGQYELTLDIYRDYLLQKGFEHVNTINGGTPTYACRIETYQNDSTGTLVEFVHCLEDDNIEIYISKYKLILSDTNISINLGRHASIEAIAIPGGVEVIWDSSDWDVAEITIEDNVVYIHGLKEGTATITAYFVYGGVRYSATCNVTVSTTYSSYGFSDVPDLAVVVGGDLEPKGVYDREDEIEFLYAGDDVNWDGKKDSSIDSYRAKLQMNGFSYARTQTVQYGNYTCTIEWYQNKSTGRVVAIMLWSDGDVGILILKN
ncbi:MAG: Ig-like domain-containing protein [Acutalibacteraceae bacterium]|nr:Ig-like domain-containing protein [Acutalibacteraceae bacterium]